MEREQQVLVDRIHSLCKHHNMSLYELSYKSSVPMTTLSNIMKGHTKNPGVFTVARLCDGFEMSLTEFFDTKDFEEWMKEMGEA